MSLSDREQDRLASLAAWDVQAASDWEPHQCVRLHAEAITMDELREGVTYLWMAGNGWMWIGTFVRRDGLFGAVIGEPVNLCRTGGVAWPDLCRGIDRDRAVTRSYADLWPAGMPLLYAQPMGEWRDAR